MRFAWYSLKERHKQHILDDDGLTLCKREHSEYAIPLDTRNDEPHPTRLLCCGCAHHLKTTTERPRPPLRTKKANFLNSRQWAEVRYQALERSNGCCEVCGRSKRDGVTLHVDHVIPRQMNPSLALDVDNLQVLCAQCNWGKGNKARDWREPRLSVLMGEAVDHEEWFE